MSIRSDGSWLRHQVVGLIIRVGSLVQTAAKRVTGPRRVREISKQIRKRQTLLMRYVLFWIDAKARRRNLMLGIAAVALLGGSWWNIRDHLRSSQPLRSVTHLSGGLEEFSTLRRIHEARYTYYRRRLISTPLCARTVTFSAESLKVFKAVALVPTIFGALDELRRLDLFQWLLQHAAGGTPVGRFLDTSGAQTAACATLNVRLPDTVVLQDGSLLAAQRGSILVRHGLVEVETRDSRWEVQNCPITTWHPCSLNGGECSCGWSKVLYVRIIPHTANHRVTISVAFENWMQSKFFDDDGPIGFGWQSFAPVDRVVRVEVCVRATNGANPKAVVPCPH